MLLSYGYCRVIETEISPDEKYRLIGKLIKEVNSEEIPTKHTNLLYLL